MSDEIEKLKMHSPDLTQDNIAKIRALFPGCVTEAAGETASWAKAVISASGVRRAVGPRKCKGEAGPKSRARCQSARSASREGDKSLGGGAGVTDTWHFSEISRSVCGSICTLVTTVLLKKSVLSDLP